MGDEQREVANRKAREMAGAAVDAGTPASATDANRGEPAKKEALYVRLPCEGHGVHRFCTEVGMILKTNGVFRRENIPVVINKENGRVEQMTAQRFRTYCAKSMITARFIWDDKTGELKERREVTMTAEIAKACLESDFFIDQQRKLTRVNVVRMPVLRKDGRIELLQEGYDPDSQIYTTPSEIKIDEAMPLEKARAIINDLVAEFPFGDYKEDTPENRAAGVVGTSRSKAVHVSAMVSLFGAGLINELVKRMHYVFTANSVASGKSLLAETAIIPVCGPAKVKPKPESSEELRKLLDSAALGAAPYVFLDDLEGLLKSNDLNAFMTAPVWSGRNMNTQTEFAMMKQTIVFITGNNLSLSGDIARRTLRCNLYTEDADAQTRQIKRVIDDEYLARPAVRGEILSALWAFIREWNEAGRPKCKRVLRGFEQWSEIFGGIVQHAGFGDPLEPPPSDDYSGDTEAADMQTLVNMLVKDLSEPPANATPEDKADWEPPKKKEFTFEELVEAAQAGDCFSWMMEGNKKTDKDTKDSWLELNQRSKSALGKMFAAKYGGRRFRLADGRVIRFGHRGRNRHRRYLVEIIS